MNRCLRNRKFPFSFYFLLLLAGSLVCAPPSIHARPDLVWQTAGTMEVAPKGVSKEDLGSLEDEFLTRKAKDPEFLEQAIAIGARRGDQPLLEAAFQASAELPEPATIDGSAHVKLYITAYESSGDPAFLGHAEEYADGLRSAWREITAQKRITAPAAATAATALLRAGRITGREDLVRSGVRLLEETETMLVGKDGAYHIFDPSTATTLMDGQLIDNASVGLAFYEAYLTTGNRLYLNSAINLADFIMERLYDRKLGGFFARNSASPEFYRPHELFVDTKPFRANALASLFLLQIGQEVRNKEYMEAAGHSIVTLRRRSKDASSAGLAILITAYNKIIEGRKYAVGEGPRRTGFAVLLLLSFLAGVLGFLSPCTLPILPAYFAFAFQSDKKKIFLMTSAFFLGLALGFSAMGATATFIGSLLRRHYDLLLKAGGILIIALGLLVLFGRGFPGIRFKPRPAATLMGSFLFGLTFSIGWTACIGPVLAVILLLAATQEGIYSGPILLFTFAMGLGIPLMTLSLSLRKMDRNGRFWRFMRGKGWDVNIGRIAVHLHTTSIVSGMLFIALGILMTGGYLTYLNRVLPIEIQAWFAVIEEWLIHFSSQ